MPARPPRGCTSPFCKTKETSPQNHMLISGIDFLPYKIDATLHIIQCGIHSLMLPLNSYFINMGTLIYGLFMGPIKSLMFVFSFFFFFVSIVTYLSLTFYEKIY